MDGDGEFRGLLLLCGPPLPGPRPAPGKGWAETFDVVPESEAAALLARLQGGRASVVAALTDPAPIDVPRCIRALEDYLPDITAILESLDKQGTVTTRRALLFEWTGSFFAEAPTPFKCQFIIYELCMVLHSLGVLSHMHGANIVARADGAGEAIPQLKDASKAFLASAAYFRCLAEETLPRWVKRDGLARHPPELDEQVALAFAHLAQAASQQCSVVAAMLNSTKSSLLSKLASAVVHETEDCLRCLELADPKCEKVKATIPTHAAYLREIFGALAFFHSGKDLSEANKCGEAIAAYVTAEAKLRIQSVGSGAPGAHNAALPGLPRSIVGSAPCVGRFLTVVTQHKDMSLRENDLMHFQVVPAQIGLPAGILLSTPTPFKLPSSGKIVSFQRETVFELAAVGAALPADAPPTALATTAPAPAPAPTPTEADGSVRECRACTFHNPQAAVSCEVCGTPMAPS